MFQGPKGPVGVGGWLLWICFGHTFIGPLGVLAYPALLKEFLGPGLFFAACLVLSVTAAASVYGGLALWNRWPSAPSLVTRIAVFNLCVSMALLVAGISAGFLSGSRVAAQLPGSVIGTVILLLYLNRSKRVEATYSGQLAQGPVTVSNARLLAAIVAVAIMLLSSVMYRSSNLVTYRSPEGGFVVEGLGPLKADSEEVEGTRVFSAHFGNDYRGFVVTDFSLPSIDMPREVISGIEQSTIDAIEGTIDTSVDELFLGQHPARRFRASFREEEVVGEVHGFIVLAHGRAYVLIASGNAGGRIEEDAHRFFESFRLLD